MQVTIENYHLVLQQVKKKTKKKPHTQKKPRTEEGDPASLTDQPSIKTSKLELEK